VAGIGVIFCAGAVAIPGRGWQSGLLFIEAALIVSDRLPSAIDRHVASRVLLRRQEAGLTQQMVADALGVTFQQFQKYERAINRISAGTLYGFRLRSKFRCNTSSKG